MTEINETLSQRGNNYGEYSTHAEIAQKLKRVIEEHHNYQSLLDHHKETLHMIFHKIGRIVNGNPNFSDSWHDIAGYATLSERLSIAYSEANKSILADSLTEIREKEERTVCEHKNHSYIKVKQNDGIYKMMRCDDCFARWQEPTDELLSEGLADSINAEIRERRKKKESKQ